MKVKEFFEKAKQKKDEAKEKIKTWLDEHPKIHSGLIIGSGLLIYGGLTAGAIALSKKTHEVCDAPMISASENENPYSYENSPKWKRVFDAEEKYGEDYQANFEKMLKFVDELDMRPGEGYMIYTDNVDDKIDSIIVSQDIYGEEGRYMEITHF